MFYDLLSWCVFLIVAIAAVEFFRWLFITPPGEEPEDDRDAEGMKEACRYDLRKFCEYYLRDTFYNEFTPRQARTIAGLQSVILFGGEFPGVIGRGEGTTSMIKAAAIWAAAYRHRKFIVLLSCWASSAIALRCQVEGELWENARLVRDFPRGKPWSPIGFYSLSENLRQVIEVNYVTCPDCVLVDSVESNPKTRAIVERRRRYLKRFVDDLHFRQPAGGQLAVANLVGVERQQELLAKYARAQAINQMTAEEIRAKFAKWSESQPISVGQAYVQSEPPAAPRGE